MGLDSGVADFSLVFIGIVKYGDERFAGDIEFLYQAHVKALLSIWEEYFIYTFFINLYENNLKLT